MKNPYHTVLAASIAWSTALVPSAAADELYRAPKPGTHTRWISPENPTGAKGAGGRLNRGAKGMAFIVVKPGETAVLADIPGAGIIHRMWLSGTIPRNPDATGVTLEVESTANLADPASWTTAGVEILTHTPDLLVVRDSQPGPHRFYRLRATRNTHPEP